MAGSKKKKDARGLPFGKKNYLWLGISFAVIVVGYFFLAQGPVDSFWSRTLAPVMLFMGYCVLIPYAILAKDK